MKSIQSHASIDSYKINKTQKMYHMPRECFKIPFSQSMLAKSLKRLKEIDRSTRAGGILRMLNDHSTNVNLIGLRSLTDFQSIVLCSAKWQVWDKNLYKCGLMARNIGRRFKGVTT